MIGKFGGSHPNVPEIILYEMERTLIYQLDHEGLAAVLVIRNVVTNFDDYIIVGNSMVCIRKLIQTMMDIVYPKEEEVPTMMDLAINTGNTGSNTPDKGRGKQSGTAGGSKTNSKMDSPTTSPVPIPMPTTQTQVDINLMSDAERVVYVNKLTTELSSKIAEISNLETELNLANSLALLKTEENMKIRSEYDLPMPFIDHKSPQKQWH